jgi:hypothetical protein
MKKIFVIFLVCVIAIGLLACNSEPVFKHVDASIAMDGAIEMSIDEKNWKQALSSRDFNLYLSNQYPSFIFQPVTTETGTPPFYSVFNDRKEETMTGYLEIPIYLRSLTLDTLVWKSASLSSPPIPWIADYDFTSAASLVETGEETYATLANAIRISIQSDQVEDQIIVYERPKNYNHNNVLGSGGDLSGDGFGTSGYLSYHHAKENSLLFGSDQVIVPDTVTEVRESFDIRIATLEEDGDFYTGKIILRIWIERWDPDSYPAITEQTFSFTFVFLGKKSD